MNCQSCLIYSLFEKKRFYFFISDLIFFFHVSIGIKSYNISDFQSFFPIILMLLIFLLQIVFFYKLNDSVIISDLRLTMILLPSIILHLYIIFYFIDNNCWYYEALGVLYYSHKLIKSQKFKNVFKWVIFLIFCFKFELFINNLIQSILYLCLFLLFFFRKIVNQKTMINLPSPIKNVSPLMNTIINDTQNDQINYKILNSFKEGIVLFDKNFKIKWHNDFLYNIMETPIEVPIENLESKILNIKEEENYVKYQSMNLRTEDKFQRFFKAFQTKVAFFNESMQEVDENNEFGLKSQMINSQMLKSQKNDCKTTQIITAGNISTNLNITKIGTNFSTLKAFDTVQNKCKYQHTHFLNSNGNFEIDHKKMNSNKLKSLKECLNEIFGRFEKTLQEISLEDINFNKFSTYGRYYYDHSKQSQFRIFCISFFTYHDDVFVVLKPLNESDLILYSINNNLTQNRLLASMCHELRTPLNSITNMLELMEFDIQHNETTNLSNNEYLNNALMNSNILLSSINDFLDYFSIASHIFELNLEEFNMKKMVYEVFEIFHFVAEKKILNFEVDYDDNIVALCYNDGKRLRQILLNILNNAFKFTIKGSIIFKIKQKMTNFLKISIEDSGYGMEPSTLKSLANFCLINESNETTGGFGLCITNHLINFIGPQENQLRYNGVFRGLKVKTETNKGTKFSFFVRNNLEEIKIIQESSISLKDLSYNSIPFESENNILIMAKKKFKFMDSRNNLSRLISDHSLLHQNMIHSCRCYKVLAVDDNDFNLFVLSENFKKAHIQFDQAKNGDEAIKKIGDFLNQKPEGSLKFCEKCKFYKVILMDIDMPVKNGYETTRELKKLFKNFNINVPIIALSAFSQNDSKEKAIEAGMHSYLVKPFTYENLQSIVNKYI